jgi:hypothetical protein
MVQVALESMLALLRVAVLSCQIVITNDNRKW